MTVPRPACDPFRRDFFEAIERGEAECSAEARRHFESCSSCRTELDEVTAFETGLQLIRDEAPIDPALRERFRHAFKEAQRLHTMRQSRRRIGIISAIAAMFVISGITWLALPRESLRFQMTTQTRSSDVDGWNPGERFHLRVEGGSKESYLYVVNVDATGLVEFYFPYYDASEGQWSFLGHPDARLAANRTLEIPHADFGEFSIGSDSGQELFFAFTSSSPQPPVELLKLRAELSRGLDGNSAEALQKLLEERFIDVARIVYEVR